MKLRRLALVDAKGVERVVLEADRTEVRMDGQVIKTKTARHGLTIHKSNGDEVGGIGILDNGYTAMVLDGYSAHGVRERVGFRVSPDGSSSFYVNDAKGQARAFLEVDDKSNTRFKLQDDQEHPQVDVLVQPDGKVEWKGVSAQEKQVASPPKGH
ncbi:hypothetical protein ACN28E_18680 [Archangium lansingense]|uniref:hypothetical protein n=1 Tax=Archangium lansingense TaxID=2995310 RepID=UPI003B7F9A57